MANCRTCPSALADRGPRPLVVDIEHATASNPNFRTVLWTGKHLQLTLMRIPAGSSIGIEMHDDVDQFIRIESGCTLVRMGNSRDTLDLQQKIDARHAVVIPASTWHDIVNIGRGPLTLYSIYAPVQHPPGTVHRTKQDSDRAHDRPSR